MKTVDILLVEDNDGDIMLTMEAFEEWETSYKITVAKDGQAAIDFFSLDNKNTILPDIILLDINLPKKNGHEVLNFIKGEEKLKHIPVIMLTTSSSVADINLAYSNQANCYITKPNEINAFLKVVLGIEAFWVSIVKLPSKN